MKFANFSFKFESTLYRAAYRMTGRKPSSAPYLSGDGFRALCNHFYEGVNRKSFEPSRVNLNELVFCEAWHLKEFLSGPARKISCKFSAISHNGDPNIDDSISALFPATLQWLYSQNVLVSNERVVPLPIGLENKRLHYNGITRDFELIRSRSIQKKPRILSGFTVGNNPRVRGEAADQLARNPLNDTISRVNSRAYRKIAAEYMFISSPPGNGFDCHRTWEAMYLGSIPIVLRSAATDYWDRIGLPLFVVSSYEDVGEMNELELTALYSRFKKRLLSPAIWIDYWESLIRRDFPGKTA